MQRLFILGLSYALVYALQWYDPPFAEYYFYAIITCFIVCVACAHTRDPLCIGYGLIQISLMAFYICTLLPTHFWANWVLYSPEFNYSIMVYYYELVMLIAGLWGGVLLCCGGVRNACGRNNNPGKSVFEAKASV